MLTFNLLLSATGIDPKDVRLLRHQDRRMNDGWTTYNLWRRDPQEFRRYEATQGEDRFPKQGFVASFVADPLGDTVFVGLSRVVGGRWNSEEQAFSYVEETHAPNSVFMYDLERDPRFAIYEGLLVIQWGAGARAWVQYADRKDKPIIELRRDIRDVEWPGFMSIRVDQRDVGALAPNWQAKLSSANGIYLLVCPETGEQYVGAAFGAGGFLSRWNNYATNGHGGNRMLIARRKRTQAPFQISILEVFGSTMTEAEAYACEGRWKRALGSRAHGLNAN